jgi:hypothetical protein
VVAAPTKVPRHDPAAPGAISGQVGASPSPGRSCSSWLAGAGAAPWCPRPCASPGPPAAAAAAGAPVRGPAHMAAHALPVMDRESAQSARSAARERRRERMVEW